MRPDPSLLGRERSPGPARGESSEDFLPFGPPDAEQSLVRRFERQVAAHPGRSAARIAGRSMTYADLDRGANRIAGALLDALGGDAEPVAVLLAPGLDQVAAHLGVLKSGKICVPLDPAQPQPRLARVLAETGARMLLTDGARRLRAADLSDASTAAGADGRGPATLDVTTLPVGPDGAPPGVAIPPEALAYVFYTAGSTGEPKGVIQSHRNLLQMARLYHSEIRLRPSDRILCPMPLAYAGGVWGLLASLSSGASLHRAATEGAGDLPAQIADGDITVAQLMTSMLRQLLREIAPGQRFPSLRLVYTGGEVLHPADVARFRDALPGVELLYDLGSTEAGLICHLRVDPMTDPGRHVHERDGTLLVPVGYPLEGVDVLLLDPEGSAVPPGDTGQIAVRSAFLSPGYWRDPERTQAVFRPDTGGGPRRVFLTGDLGAELPDGGLLHLGRLDLRAKVRGNRIGVGEIEAALRAEPAVADVAVAARDTADGDARIVAYVACRPGRRVTVTALRRRLGALLPASMVPSAFVFLDALPLSPVGKVDRAALPEPGRDRPPLEVAYAAPRTPLEEMLVDTWAEVLALDQVGVDDEFLDLGGHSLAAAQLAFRLSGQLRLELPWAAVLEASTVAAQAQAILRSLPGVLSDGDLARLLGPDRPR